MNREDIENLVNTDFEKMQIVVNRIFKEEYVKKIEQENARLKDKIEKAINILNNPWSFESGNKEVDEITYQKKREVVELIKEN